MQPPPRLPPALARTVLVLAAAAACALPGCVSSIAVDTDYDRGADFSAWHTWAWAPPPRPGTGPESPEICDRRIVRSVGQALAERGWTSAPADAADVLVSFRAAVRREVQVVPRADPWWGFGPRWRGPYWATSGVDVWRYDVGTLVLDLIDRRTGFVAWSGRASETVDPSLDPAERDARIDSAVRTLLDRFPPPK